MQKLKNNAALPKRSTDGAAGYDLCASQDCTIPAGGKGLVHTGLSISFPAGLYARIAPRSGLALKKFIDVGAGVVDSDYRGKVGVVLFNHGDQDFVVKMGDRIAQLILEKIDTPPVEEVQGLDNTVRGTGGFGSTGVKSSNDTGRNSEEKEMNGENERTGEKKEREVKNETLKGRFGSSRTRTVKKTKIEGSSRLSLERQIISVKQLKKLVMKKTPVFLAVVWGCGVHSWGVPSLSLSTRNPVDLSLSLGDVATPATILLRPSSFLQQRTTTCKSQDPQTGQEHRILGKGTHTHAHTRCKTQPSFPSGVQLHSQPDGTI